jgi:hypothetical protein
MFSLSWADVVSVIATAVSKVICVIFDAYGERLGLYRQEARSRDCYEFGII